VVQTRRLVHVQRTPDNAAARAGVPLCLTREQISAISRGQSDLHRDLPQQRIDEVLSISLPIHSRAKS
jgi:hypothetical protein